MLNFTQTTPRVLFILIALHVFIIAVSNYAVQFPLQLFGLHSTWGALTFPFIFLATDLTVRVLGKIPARKVIFFAMLPALLVSYYFSVVFADGQFVGHSGLAEFNLFIFRIVIASFTAYVLGQLLDIQIFDRLRQMSAWWVAPLTSTILGNFMDTLCFFSIAFYRSSDAYMASHWVEIAALDYAFKMAMSVFIFLPIYGVLLSKIQRLLTTQNRSAPMAAGV